MDKKTIHMRDWNLYIYNDIYRLRGTGDNVPGSGKNAYFEIKLREVTNSFEEDVLIWETVQHRYVCPLKYMDIKPYSGIDKDYLKELVNRYKKSDNWMEAVILASAELTLDKRKGKLAKHILKLRQEGQKELDAIDEAFYQHLMNEARKYENCIYIEWQNEVDTNVLAYHIGDKVGIVKPTYHVGTTQDSVLYTKYPDSQDDVSLDFRYFPQGLGSYETYVWSENITQAVIKNTQEWNMSLNCKRIKSGKERAFPWDGSPVHEPTKEYDYLIALDSFKGSMTSLEAGLAVKKGLEARNPEANILVVPVADGGEGTVEALSYGRDVGIRTVQVTGPLGESVEATYTVIDGTTAIMEMSQAAGITLVPEDKRNPLVTTTYGVGEMIADAVEAGCDHIIMGIGGSATNDCGIGMLQALGFDILDNASKNVCFGANALPEVEHISASRVDDRIKKCKFTIACDVDNPLTGELGCSRIFAPQKGATPAMVEDMDRWMLHFVDEVEKEYGKQSGQTDTDLHLTPGAGAAGGLGYAFLRFLGGELKSGADIVIEQLELDDKLIESKIVIVGEGCLDKQTTMGKIPAAIAKLARKNGCMVIAVAGVVKDVEELKEAGLFHFIKEIDRGDMSIEEAMVKENAMNNLERTARRIFK